MDLRLYDADQHYYEPEDAIHRHIEKAYRKVIRWVDLDGRRSLIVNDKLLSLIPNPTYDPVGVPGSLERYYRSQNQAGQELRDMIRMQPIQPEYRDRAQRVAKLDAQGVEFAWVLPSLGLGLEEMLYGEPAAWHAVMRAYNRWLDDDWGYDRDGRIQTGPLLSFVDPVEGERELARVIALGAKFVVLRPAPVASSGRNRSPADPAHDRIWAMAAEAGVVVAFHAADSGYGKLLQQWGESDRYSGQKGSPLTEFFSAHNERPISDTLAALICHGVFERHPALRVACVELGAGWAPELVRRMKITFGKMPQAFAFKDPVETFQRHVWVAPFYEDDLRRVREAIPAERLLLGSDWPHPEGLPEPRAGIADYEVLPEAEQRLALRENLKALVGH